MRFSIKRTGAALFIAGLVVGLVTANEIQYQSCQDNLRIPDGAFVSIGSANIDPTKVDLEKLRKRLSDDGCERVPF